jgi:aspartate aminotransferase
LNIDRIKPTAAVALADIARGLEASGKSIVKLQTGDPDFSTHPEIVIAMSKAIAEGNTHYSFSQGLPVLRDKIASLIAAGSGASLNRNNVIITNGAIEGMYSVMAGLIEPGDEVLILEPNWPTVDSLVMLMGGIPVKINFLDTSIDILKALDNKYSEKTKLLCFNTPNNPTGKVIAQEELDAICDWAISKNIYILADEVYRSLQFDSAVSTSYKYLGMYTKYIFVDSFSKKFAMTGWRIGYVATSVECVKNIAKASQITITNVAAFIQYAALAALNNESSLEYADNMRDQYKSRRDGLVRYCSEIGLEIIHPDGAFYLFLKLPGEMDDVKFCHELLNKDFICVVPGSAFGEAGKHYIRLSYANTIDEVKKGLDGIRKNIPKA